MSGENLPVIAGITVTTDEFNRFNLNAIYKASGEGAHKKPSQWLRREETKAIIAELESNLLKNSQGVNLHLAQKVINIKHGGYNAGTYAHEILAVEYAGWIRPDFRILVNQTFIDYRIGNLTPVQEKKNDYLAEYRQSRALKMAISSVNELFCMMPELSDNSKQCVAAHIINPIAGFEVVPLPVLAEKLYTATEIGKIFNVSSNKIGRIANDNGMKINEYGEIHLDKSPYSNKQVQSFHYNAKALDKFRAILVAEQEALDSVMV